MEQFYEISIILLVAFIISALMRALKQPLVIGYILTGLIVGPYFLNILQSVEVVELFSKLGITSLLFIVGLGLSPKVLKELGVVAGVTGVGQVLFTSVVGFIITKALGFGNLEAGYIAVAITFSSTIIILKLLSDKGDVSKLYGKIAIGFLLVQDIIAALILVAILGFTKVEGATGIDIAIDLVWLLAKGIMLLVALMWLSSKVLPRLTDFIAKSQEFLFIFSLAWGMAIASIYYKMGLSIEIGALVAGVTLSLTPYSFEISSRLKPLRDFFITLFFILLGSQMVFTNWQALVAPTILLSVFILVGNPIIVLILMNLLGYTKRTGFMAGLTVAQISEFSLILIKLGFDVGHLPEDVLSMVTLVGIITIAGSTYLILYSEQIFNKIQKYLSFFEFRKSYKKHDLGDKNFDAIIFGYKRAGPEFAQALNHMKSRFLVIDFNPDVIHEMSHYGISAEYGDAADPEFLQELPFKETKIVVSSIPDFDTNLLLTKFVRKVNQEAIVIVITDTMDHALELYNAGVTNVILSHYIGAKHAAEMLKKYGYENKKYKHHGSKHAKELEETTLFSIA